MTGEDGAPGPQVRFSYQCCHFLISKLIHSFFDIKVQATFDKDYSHFHFPPKDGMGDVCVCPREANCLQKSDTSDIFAHFNF